MTHKIVVGLGFGDEAKGATVDWLSANNDIKAVIRFNGGPQAAHNVVTASGLHHTFAQFGSGTFSGVPTHLSRFMLFNPFNIWPERQHLMDVLGLPDPLDGLTVSRDALLITPYHREANRRREDARGHARHGSTGQGIGETRYYQRDYPAMVPRVQDMKNPYVLRRLLTALRDYYVASGFDMSDILEPNELVQQYIEMAKLINIVPDEYTQELLDSGDCVFEGAQGVLLDELYGFNPHTTFSATTQRNARTLLDGRPAETWGLTRSYHTRHGHGPFPTEGLGVGLDDVPEMHNGTGHFQGGWRVGALDLSLLRYAVKVNGGVDYMSVSHMDYVGNHDGIITDGYAEGYTISTPHDRVESHEYGPTLFGAKPIIREQNATQRDIATAILEATGAHPVVYSYGPRREDRVLANVPALS